MASEASWQTGTGRNGEAPLAQGPMDQQSVESLLRRLVERVEENERRYAETLDELHARLDQLSQTTDAARATGSPENAATLDRLHNQVSDLSRRLEQDTAAPLDDFERLGKALAGGMDYAPGGTDVSSGMGDEPGAGAYGSRQMGESPFASGPNFSSSTPEAAYSASPAASLENVARDLDKHLVEMAHRLEHSIDTAMPTATIEALNARLDEIGNQLSQALAEAPQFKNLEHVEHQLSELAQQIGRAEVQLARVSGIESQLLKLIERVDETPARLEEVASKAASAAVRLVAEEAKPSTSTDERLDAMHRDLMAMNDRTRASDDRLANTIAAVHESLKQLVQQVERGTPPSPAPKPRVPFAERVRELGEKALPPLPPSGFAGQQPLAEVRIEKGGSPMNGDTNGAPAGAPAKDKSPRNRLGAAIPDFQESEAAPPFGRAKRGQSDEQAFDLDALVPRRSVPEPAPDEDYATPDDLVAAARRAAQAAALRAEERSSGSRVRRASASPAAELSSDADVPSRRKRSVLIICAAVLLMISAALLYGRLRSKPEPEVSAPAAEQSAPLPQGAHHGTPTPETDGAPAPVEPKAETPPAKSGSSELEPEPEDSPDDSAASSEDSETSNFTEVAKSSYRPEAALETAPQPLPASLKPNEPAALPPGVVFSIEDPAKGTGPAGSAAPSSPLSVPVSLPLPPVELGPLTLRQAASGGDARAQYAIALRYAQGQGTARDLTEAVHWLERAASAGLAPAQYRLAAMYERGQGVAKDLGRAQSWYQAAAEKGNIKAMHNLAVGASARQDGKADYALASKWYAEAAAYGLGDSQFNLGILSEHGLGIPKNLAEAYKWFALAAKNGDEEATKRRELVKLELDPATLAEAEQAVKAWRAKDADPVANEVPESPEWAEAAAAPNASLVTHTQALLNKLGYDVGTPDGQLGDRTREAIKSFERRNGLEETGNVTLQLVTKLERLTSCTSIRDNMTFS
jgi:localization factor PodJL